MLCNYSKGCCVVCVSGAGVSDAELQCFSSCPLCVSQQADASSLPHIRYSPHPTRSSLAAQNRHNSENEAFVCLLSLSPSPSHSFTLSISLTLFNNFSGWKLAVDVSDADLWTSRTSG